MRRLLTPPPKNIPDIAPTSNPRGLALRFLLSTDEHHHTDIITHSTPLFPTRTGEDFLAMLRAIGDGTIETFLSANPSAAGFVKEPKPFPASFATATYWGVNAFVLVSANGERKAVRYRIVPEAGERSLSDEELQGLGESYLFDEIVKRLGSEAGTIGFKLMAQVAREGDATDDATLLWGEDRQVVELGRVVMETLLGKAESDRMQKGVIFDPIPRVEGVEVSDDPLLEVRAGVYLISGRERRAAGE
jgi:catalase